jgi:hypothetical protein
MDVSFGTGCCLWLAWARGADRGATMRLTRIALPRINRARLAFALRANRTRVRFGWNFYASTASDDIAMASPQRFPLDRHASGQID